MSKRFLLIISNSTFIIYSYLLFTEKTPNISLIQGLYENSTDASVCRNWSTLGNITPTAGWGLRKREEILHGRVSMTKSVDPKNQTETLIVVVPLNKLRRPLCIKFSRWWSPSWSTTVGHGPRDRLLCHGEWKWKVNSTKLWVRRNGPLWKIWEEPEDTVGTFVFEFGDNTCHYLPH